VIDARRPHRLSLAAIDPSQMLRNMMGSDESRIKVETEVNDVKLLLEERNRSGRRDSPARPDLDLAFVRPKAPLATPVPPVDLAKRGQSRVLDPVIGLNRLGSAAGRAYSPPWSGSPPLSSARACSIFRMRT